MALDQHLWDAAEVAALTLARRLIVGGDTPRDAAYWAADAYDLDEPRRERLLEELDAYDWKVD